MSASRPPILVSACTCSEDCDAVAAICSTSFPAEVHAQGLSVQQWASLEAEALCNTPSWWRQIGLARDGPGGKLLGVVVLTLEHEADEPMGWLEYSRRVGCFRTVLCWLYDRVLEEPLLGHECLIDFIAVSPEARGRGVGALLMGWAERAGATILAETEAAAVAAHGVDMTLWVAADNAVACRLYQRSGYSVVKRTDRGAFNCLASHVLKWFLGHPGAAAAHAAALGRRLWLKMRKQLPVPKQLAMSKPQQQAIPLAVAAGAAAAASLACSSGEPDAAFVDVPLGTSTLPAQAPGMRIPSTDSVRQGGSSAAAGLPRPTSAEQGAQPAPEASPSGRLACKERKGSKQAAGTAGASAGGAVAVNSAAQQQAGMPRVAAVDAWHQLGQQESTLNPPAAAGGRQQLALGLGGAVATACADGKLLTRSSAAAMAALAQPCPPSVASASVASFPTSPGDSESEAEEEAAEPAAVARHSSGAQAALRHVTTGSDVFELVSLHSESGAVAGA